MSTFDVDIQRHLAALGPALDHLNGLFWFLFLTGIAWALLPKRRSASGRIWRSLLVLALTMPPVITAVKDQVAIQDFKARQRVAEAHFRKRCESAGEFIHRRVQGVESIWWMKRRPRDFDSMSQYQMQDPYGHDCWDLHCVHQLLRLQGTSKPTVELRTYSNEHGFLFVEAEDDQGRLKRFRKIAAPREPTIGETRNNTTILIESLDGEEIIKPGSNYGITWADISSHTDRDMWIAGGVLRIIDLQTQEIVAERIGYLWDSGMGGGVQHGRQPWSFATRNACPPLGADPQTPGQRDYDGQLKFIRKVLAQ